MSGSWSLGKYRNIQELYYDAMFERAGDNLIVFKVLAQSAIQGNNDVADVWAQGGVKVYPTSAATASVVSTDDGDKPGSTGLHSIVIRGLDSNYNIIGETLILDGLTPVTTVNSYLRINTTRTAGEAGSNIFNIGKITLTIGGDIQATISPDKGLSEQTHYTVPANYTALVTNISLNVYKGSGVSGRRATRFAGVSTTPQGGISSTFYGLTSDGTGYLETNSLLPLRLVGKSDLKWTFSPESNDTQVSVSYDLVLIKQDFLTNNLLF